jgi:lysophospholipase L1-like esterase
MDDSAYRGQVQPGAAPRLRGGREILARLLIVLSAVLVAALLCELAMRLGGYTPIYFNPLNAFHEPHALVGYRGKPGFVGRFRKPDFDVVIAQDENGFRLPAHQVPRPASRMAVLAFGDSFTWGWGVGQGKVFTDVMSRLMPDVHVANFGLNASGTVQQFTLFEAYGKEQLRPGDVVLLLFFSNDFGDNVNGRLRAEISNGRVVLAGPARPLGFRPSDVIESSSYLVNLIFFSANRFKGAMRRDRAESRATRLVEVGERTPEIAVARHYLAAFRDVCQAKQAHFVAAYVPEQAELGEAPRVDENRQRNDQAFRRAFFDCAGALGIPTIDLLPAFLAAKAGGPRGQQLTFPHDSHWNEQGHEVAARTFVRYLSSIEGASMAVRTETGERVGTDGAAPQVNPPR